MELRGCGCRGVHTFVGGASRIISHLAWRTNEMGLIYHEIIQSIILIYHTHYLQLCLPSIRDHGIVPICEVRTIPCSYHHHMGLIISILSQAPSPSKTLEQNQRTQPRCVSNNGCQDDWEAYSKFQAEVGDSVQPLGWWRRKSLTLKATGTLWRVVAQIVVWMFVVFAIKIAESGGWTNKTMYIYNIYSQLLLKQKIHIVLL